MRTARIVGRVETTAIIQDIDALRAAAGALPWSALKSALQTKIAEAILNGGTTSYTINGRSKSVSVDWLRQMLSECDKQAAADAAPGGHAYAYAGFARVGCEG